MAVRAKVFMHGRSQAVRLPLDFRFEGREVRATKVGKRVILEPIDVPADVPWSAIDSLGSEFPEREQPDMPPDRVVFGE